MPLTDSHRKLIFQTQGLLAELAAADLGTPAIDATTLLTEKIMINANRLHIIITDQAISDKAGAAK